LANTTVPFVSYKIAGDGMSSVSDDSGLKFEQTEALSSVQ